MKELSAESDRAAVIVGAAKLDLLLYQILQRCLKPSTANTDELLDGDSPLSPFSAKIHLVFRLGLIDAHLARALTLTRRIRNVFAHEHASTSLASGAHRDRVKELIAPLLRFEIFEEARENFPGNQMPGPSHDFRVALAMMIIRLEGLLEACTEAQPGAHVTLIDSDWAPVKRGKSNSTTTGAK